MAKCRITNLTPPCGYNVQGVVAASVVDFDDFGAFEFDDDGLEDTALVTNIYGLTPIGLPVSLATRYTSSKAGKVYTHTLETFIPALSAQLIASLNLATRRRFVVIFTAGNGSRFVFGYENGATLTYTAQTAEALGAMVTLTALSAHPLFELSPTAKTGAARVTFDVDFDFGAYCIQKNG